MAPEHVPVVDKSLFASWLAGLEAHGVLRLLGFGDLVLLKPELLDAYASALVIAAGNSENGLAALAEEDVLAGRFVPGSGIRLTDSGQERLLLLGTLDEMFRAELILREPSEEGVFLVFPSEMRHGGPACAISAAGATRFRFEGPSQNIYSTLIVRLAHCGLYKKVEMWAGGAQFRSRENGMVTIQLTQPEEGVAQIDLTFDKALGRGARSGLESYIERHLHRRAVDSSVSMTRSIVCAECGTQVSDDQVRRRRERHFSWIRCNVCEAEIPLIEQDEALAGAGRVAALQMDGVANNRRDKEVAANIVRAKNQANDFDVFLAHNSRDKDAVQTLADNLRMKGINPWLDAERVPPGRFFQDRIQGAIASVRSAAVILGPFGVGKWELVELRTVMSACVEKDIPVIPVLLPGVSGVPEELSFLRELSYVKFENTLSEEPALAQLQWGILADRPVPHHLRTA